MFKIGFIASKKIVFINFNQSPLKLMKNAFYFMLITLFVVEIFAFLFCYFGYVGKLIDKKAMVNFKVFEVTD